MQELVKFIISGLVDDKDAVNVEIEDENVKVSVAKDDMGKIIGKQGRTAKAIRTIVKAVGAKENKKYNVEIVEI